MPEVKIVDMRDELRSGNSSVISRKLLASIEQTVNKWRSGNIVP